MQHFGISMSAPEEAPAAFTWEPPQDTTPAAAADPTPFAPLKVALQVNSVTDALAAQDFPNINLNVESSLVLPFLEDAAGDAPHGLRPARHSVGYDDYDED